MLRSVCDLLRLATVEETVGRLSDLASVLIHAAYEIVDKDLRLSTDADASTRGWHMGGNGICRDRHGASVGAHELNYSSTSI